MTEVFDFNDSNAITILKMLQTDTSANKNGIWNSETFSVINDKCSSAKNLVTLRDVDLKSNCEILKEQSKRKAFGIVYKKDKS